VRKILACWLFVLATAQSQPAACDQWTSHWSTPVRLSGCGRGAGRPMGSGFHLWWTICSSSYDLLIVES